MKNFAKKVVFAIAFFAVCSIYVPVAFAQEDVQKQIKELEQQINEIKKKVGEENEKKNEEMDVLKEEIRKLRLELAMPDQEYKSYAGLGPAASKVYFVPRGLSIGGYGEITYENYLHSTKTDRGDTLKFIPYFGCKFSDNLVMNTEIEIEHAGIKNISPRNPEVYTEFMYVDFLMKPQFNVRTGLLLVPSSKVNEYHEPTVYYGTLRPDVERNIIPTVWRKLGVMAYGDFVSGFSYKLALLNGLRTDTISDWIGGGRQRGAEVNFSQLSGVLQLNYDGGKGWSIGGFVFSGKGEDKAGAAEAGTQKADIQLYAVETQFQRGNLWLKGLYSAGRADGNNEYSCEQAAGAYCVDSTGKALSVNRAKGVKGWYVEAAYNIMPHVKPESLSSLSPYIRYERYNLHDAVFAGKTPDASKDRKVFTMGMDYKPHPQVVLKMDYQIRDTASDKPDGKGTGLDENKINQFNAQIGFIF